MTATGERAVATRVAWSAWPDTAQLYRFSLRLGLRSLRPRHARAALPRLLNPLSYPRGMEYALTLRGLDLPETARVLDIASPKLLFLWLAAKTRLELTATDIRGSFIPSARDLLERLGLADQIGGRLRLETQDARSLTYADGRVDAVYSVSVLEHIPDDGDTLALREIARVLRPGGRVSLTVPFSAVCEEEWVGRDVFERRRRRGEKIFFQRRYDNQSLQQRLIMPSGLLEKERAYFGEPALPFDRWWSRLPMLARLPFAWAQPFCERLLLRELDEGRQDRAIGVALTLAKEGGALGGS
jgi:SAM-dependent methyltransferase